MDDNKQITTIAPTKEKLVKVTRHDGIEVAIKESLAKECLTKTGWKKGWKKKKKGE